MEIMGGSLADAQLAKFRTSPAPRMTSPRSLSFLERMDAHHARKRMNFEYRLADDIGAELETVRGQIFAASEMMPGLRAEVAAEQRGYSGGAVAGRGEQNGGLAAGEPNLLRRSRNDRDAVEKPVAIASSGAERRLREVADRLTVLRAKSAALGRREHSLNERLTACEKFLSHAQLMGAAPVIFSPPVPPGKITRQQVQDRVAKLKGSLEDAKLAPLPAKFACDRAVKWVKSRKTPINALPLLKSLIDESGATEPYVAKMTYAGSGGAIETANALGVVYWLFEDLLIERLTDQIKRGADDDKALDPDKQKAVIKQIEEDLLAAQFVDENIVWEMLLAGKDVELNADADPRAILSARLDK